MKKSIKVQPKKRRGRPATGKDPLLTVRAPRTIIEAIENWAEKNEISRSEAVRRLVELGLKAKGK
jgi:Ribbon-helix-helix protein, copG family